MKKTILILFVIVALIGISLFFGWQDRSYTGWDDRPIASWLSSTQELSNQLGDPSISWLEVANSKQADAKNDDRMLIDAAFAQSVLWDLSSAETLLDTYCTNHETDSACQKIHIIYNTTPPIDQDGQLVQDAHFSILWQDSDVQNFRYDAYPNTIVRSKISKEWYTDHFSQKNLTLWPDENKQVEEIFLDPVILLAAQDKISLSVGSAFEVTTEHYTFSWDGNNFLSSSNESVDGDIDVYFFDLWRNTGNFEASSLLALDVFDSRDSIVWFRMNTFGMPLVKAYKNGEELKIDPNNPIRVEGYFQDHSDYLSLINRDIDPESIYTDVPVWTKITVDNAESFGMPPFWRLDSEYGIWVDSSYTLLDSSGRVEAFIY